MPKRGDKITIDAMGQYTHEKYSWICVFCGRKHYSRRFITIHEKECKKNPINGAK